MVSPRMAHTDGEAPSGAILDIGSFERPAHVIAEAFEYAARGEL